MTHPLCDILKEGVNFDTPPFHAVFFICFSTAKIHFFICNLVANMFRNNINY